MGFGRVFILYLFSAEGHTFFSFQQDVGEPVLVGHSHHRSPWEEWALPQESPKNAKVWRFWKRAFLSLPH